MINNINIIRLIKIVIKVKYKINKMVGNKGIVIIIKKYIKSHFGILYGIGYFNRYITGIIVSCVFDPLTFFFFFFTIPGLQLSASKNTKNNPAQNINHSTNEENNMPFT